MANGKQFDHGRHSVPVTYTLGVYSAIVKGDGNPAPFFINAEVAGVVTGKLMDSAADTTINVGPGTNPDLFISITETGTTATNLHAVYSGLPPTITIKVNE